MSERGAAAAAGARRRSVPRTPQPVRARSAAAFRSHGYHLSQMMRFAVEEINNSSALLPNVTLGYEIHDTCTEAANLHGTLRALGREGRHDVEVLSAPQRYEPRAVAVIGPDSTQLALTTAAILGVFLVPEVSSAPPAALWQRFGSRSPAPSPCRRSPRVPPPPPPGFLCRSATKPLWRC